MLSGADLKQNLTHLSLVTFISEIASFASKAPSGTFIFRDLWYHKAVVYVLVSDLIVEYLRLNACKIINLYAKVLCVRKEKSENVSKWHVVRYNLWNNMPLWNSFVALIRCT